MKKSILLSIFLTSFLLLITVSQAITVSVDPGKIIGSNKLLLGTQTSFGSTKTFSGNLEIQNLVIGANIKLIRAFDHHFGYGPSFNHPCKYWNETTKACQQWDWTYVDSWVQKVFDIGAEPLIGLGYVNQTQLIYNPKGMSLNPTTHLPYPDQWAAYCREWVKHFKNTGKPVKYYEVINEPWMYFGWNNYTEMSYFRDVFNSAAASMRTENPNILLGFDGANRKPVLNWWLTNGGADLSFLSFHKYDSGSIGQYSDSKLLNLSESFLIDSDNNYYGIEDARQKYYSSRGKLVPVLITEANLNSAFSGTDPRIQKMTGAVWTALSIRSSILKGLNYFTYFDLSSSKSWELQNKKGGGIGFGLVNSDDRKPYYPYFVMKILGTNSALGDSIVNSSSNSDHIRTLSWINNGKLNILLIHKNTTNKTVSLQGVTGSFNYQKIDDPTGLNYNISPSVQIGVVNAGDAITLNGYTVMLLQQSTTIPTCTCGTWTNGVCNVGGCVNQRQQTRTCTPIGCTPTDGLGTSRCVADSLCQLSMDYIQLLPTLKGVNFNPKMLSGTEKGCSIPPCYSTSMNSSNYPSVNLAFNNISSHGFNFVRVNFYWESYVINPTSFLNEIENTAKAAQSAGLYIIFDFGQYGTASYFYGNAYHPGFPSYLLTTYPNNTNGEKLFWTNFYNNTITYNGNSIWNLQAELFHQIINRVDKYSSVIGYEILNEPPIYDNSQYQKLGNFHTYVAQKIRSFGSNKAIVFDRAYPVSDSSYVDWNFYNQIVPIGISGTIFAPHRYSNWYKGIFDNYKKLAADWGGVPVIIGEWAESNEGNMSAYISELKNSNFGWSYYSWSTGLSSQNLVDSTWTNLTVYGKWLINAMCSSRLLINKCSQCGCPSGQGCQSDGSCKSTVVQKMIVGVDYWSNNTETKFTNTDLPLLKDAGIKMVRLEFSPSYLYNLATLVPAIKAAGIDVLGVLIEPSLDPDGHVAYGNWVYNTVNEFKSYVHVWEIWNEPNLNDFFSGKDPVKYTNFLKEGYTKAKQADPTCTVLGGSVVFTHQDALNFLTTIYQNGGKNYMDALSYHPYCTPYAPNDTSSPNPFVKLTDVRTVMANYGDTRPLWITEVGWTTNDNGKVDETNQSNYLVKALQIARDWGWVETFIIYNWKDSSTSGSLTKGLLRTDRTPKPSYYAVKDFIGTGTNFACNYVQTNNLWGCSLDYTNNMNERTIVKFHFIDSATSEVKSTGTSWANMGSSGTVGSEISCNSYHGTYNVVWRAYRTSDTSYSNPVAMSTSFKTVTC